MGDTLRTDDQIYQATNQEELRRQIMSACVPKNEREHWASGEIARLERELADARAEIERLKRIVDEMTEEQAALCAEGQSITELVAAKDGLVEQMREALENIRDYPGHIDYTTGEVHSMQEIAIAALTAEGGE